MSTLVKAECKMSNYSDNAKVVKHETNEAIFDTSSCPHFHAIDCDTGRKVTFVSYESEWSTQGAGGKVREYLIFYTDTLEEITPVFYSWKGKAFMIDMDQELLRGKQ